MDPGVSERRTVARKALLGNPVPLQHRPAHLGGTALKPPEERRSEVEADPAVVVDQLLEPPLGAEDPRPGVGGVALGGDPFVPVVPGIGRGLLLHHVQPGVLPGGLVEVAVHANVTSHEGGPYHSPLGLSNPLEIDTLFGMCLKF